MCLCLLFSSHIYYNFIPTHLIKRLENLNDINKFLLNNGYIIALPLTFLICIYILCEYINVLSTIDLYLHDLQLTTMLSLKLHMYTWLLKHTESTMILILDILYSLPKERAKK